MKWFLGVIMLSSIVCFDGFCLMHEKLTNFIVSTVSFLSLLFLSLPTNMYKWDIELEVVVS